METLCFVQRHSDSLCKAITDRELRDTPQLLTEVINQLTTFGVDVNFSAKAWTPLHYAARSNPEGCNLVKQLLQVWLHGHNARHENAKTRGVCSSNPMRYSVARTGRRSVAFCATTSAL